MSAASRTVRPVSIASFAQSQNVRKDDQRNEVEGLMPVIAEVFGNIGITKDDVDFICSGSTDYLIGGPFSFVMALDAVGVWPPRSESHVEMDGAWALYEAWVLLQEGEIDAAEPLRRMGDQGFEVGFPGDIGGDQRHVRAQIPRLQIAHDDLCAILDQPPRDREADAGRATGHHGGFARETSAHAAKSLKVPGIFFNASIVPRRTEAGVPGTKSTETESTMPP